MIYARKRRYTICGHTVTEFTVTWDRVPANTRKLIAQTALFIAVVLATFTLLEATDIPDYKPTVTLKP